MTTFSRETVHTGDEVTIKAKVLRAYDFVVNIKVDIGCGECASFNLPYGDLVTCTPRPLKVGDTVNYSGSPDWGILAIHEDMAWIKYLAKNGTGILTTSLVRLNCLTRT